jgi:hypothetical protein
MSERVLPMVGLDKTVVSSDALPRRRPLLQRGHTSFDKRLVVLSCARLRPKVTDRKQELSLFTQTRDHSQRGD